MQLIRHRTKTHLIGRGGSDFSARIAAGHSIFRRPGRLPALIFLKLSAPGNVQNIINNIHRSETTNQFTSLNFSLRFRMTALSDRMPGNYLLRKSGDLRLGWYPSSEAVYSSLKKSLLACLFQQTAITQVKEGLLPSSFWLEKRADGRFHGILRVLPSFDRLRMTSYKHWMTNDKPGMTNDKNRMINDKPGMTNDKHRMTIDRLRMINDRIGITIPGFSRGLNISLKITPLHLSLNNSPLKKGEQGGCVFENAIGLQGHSPLTTFVSKAHTAAAAGHTTHGHAGLVYSKGPGRGPSDGAAVREHTIEVAPVVRAQVKADPETHRREIKTIADSVYKMIERRLMIERERKGR